MDSIHKAFVATPDEGGRSFIDKFRDPIKPAGSDVRRLAAEWPAVYWMGRVQGRIKPIRAGRSLKILEDVSPFRDTKRNWRAP